MRALSCPRVGSSQRARNQSDHELTTTRSAESRLVLTKDSTIAEAVGLTDKEMAIAQGTFHLVNEADAWDTGAHEA